jgi:hypothetical protein
MPDLASTPPGFINPNAYPTSTLSQLGRSMPGYGTSMVGTVPITFDGFYTR